MSTEISPIAHARLVDTGAMARLAWPAVTVYVMTRRDRAVERAFGYVQMNFFDQAKAIVTDSHFLVPFCVLAAGIVLLVFLH